MFGRSGNFFGFRGVRLQVAVAVVAGADFLLFGYDQGVTGSLLTLESFRRHFPSIDTLADGISPSERSTRSTNQGIAVASYNLGSFLGAVACIWLGNALGRRKTIFLGTAVMIVGAILQASSYQLAQFIIGRIVTDLVTIDFGFYFLDPSEISWRFPLAFQIVFCLFILSFVMSMPESPRWLVYHGKEDEAMHVLGALSDVDPDSQYVREEFHAIKDTVLEASKGSFRDLFTMDENRHFHRTVLAYMNQVFQQISGINLITYYIPNVLQNEVGLSPFLAKLIAACNGTEYFLASWIAVFTIEKVGRRKLMLFGAAGSSSSGIAETVFLFAFNTFFAIGWLGMTWLYPAEIVPLKIRAPANALSTTANWIFNFMVVMITPVAFENIGYRTYIIFAVINAAIFPIVYYFYPETAYRSLEEMDSIFVKCKSVFTVVRIAKEEPRRYGKKGEVLISYDETDMSHRRQSSVTATSAHKQEKDEERKEVV
ncbi:hypothetical protein LTS08_005207 [Lithohypha guttulata]|nr:hypothetical protein LTS08_005207 [Lithohypha guttulata]